MVAMQFAENYYSFRAFDKVFIGDFHPNSPDPAALIAIEDALVEANNLYVARRYQEAIDAYHRAEALIYAHLDPGYPGGVPSFHGQAVSRNPALFTPLLSAAAEWLNVLPVHEPVATVQPRVSARHAMLDQAAQFNQAGLVSTRLSSTSSISAAADWRLARTYAAQGNQRNSQIFLERARKADPDLVAILDRAAGGNPGETSGAEAMVESVSAVANGPSVATASALTDIAVVAPRVPIPPALVSDRTVGMVVNGEVKSVAWTAGNSAPIDQIRALAYEHRVNLTDLGSVIRLPWLPHHVALDLPHSYYYVIPLGLAECYHALGDYQKAEASYLQAASYQYLNKAIEAPYLWQRLATLYLDWGNVLFRGDDAPSALPVYQNVLMEDGSVPGSALYTTAALQPGADAARTVIANLDKLVAGTVTAAALGVNPALAAITLEVRQHLLQIAGGLDFWGHWHNTVPIWTFEYLQGVAINFAQLAITAERDVINFLDRADQATLVRQQLAQSVNEAKAEAAAADMQAKAARAEADAYQAGLDLANKRAADAGADAAEYASTSALQIQHQALSAQLSGGDDGDINQLNGYADAMMGIGATAEFLRTHPGWHLSGSGATLAAAEQLAASRLNRQYEVDSLKRQADEMKQAAVQAKDERDAAKARQGAADAASAAAQLRAADAQNNLDAFDDQFFTPDVWHRMGDAMWRIYSRYLTMAIRAARLMQRAYNFETDQTLSLIKSDYSTSEVKGLLGADALMADIQTFTYDLITSKASKPQPMKQTISLAQRYGFAFENQLRRLGTMAFETRIDDFDYYYPGTYAGRIEAVEVEVDGIVPVSGLSGILTNNGISFYRTPASTPPGPPGSGLKCRVQTKETLVLSDFSARQDSLLIPNDQRMLRVFQGAGLASTWQLDLPKAINDIDYGALTDVRLTFYYKARFDPDLKDRVLNELASRPGIDARLRGIPLRWIYPDAFFRLQDTGQLNIALLAADFRHNETKPMLTEVGVQVATDGSVAPGGLAISLSTPGKAAATDKTDATGAISSDRAGSTWAPLTGGTALGPYTIAFFAADNPGLVVDGKLNLAPIANIALILGYTFTPKA